MKKNLAFNMNTPIPKLEIEAIKTDVCYFVRLEKRDGQNYNKNVASYSSNLCHGISYGGTI